MSFRTKPLAILVTGPNLSHEEYEACADAESYSYEFSPTLSFSNRLTLMQTTRSSPMADCLSVDEPAMAFRSCIPQTRALRNTTWLRLASGVKTLIAHKADLRFLWLDYLVATFRVIYY